MAPPTVNLDSHGLGRLLDESQEFFEEAKRAEDQEGAFQVLEYQMVRVGGQI